MIIGLLAVLGLFFGILISFYTKEELKDGEKYFKILEFIILIALFFLTFKYNTSLLFLVIGALLGITIRNIYFFFGILLGSSFVVSFIDIILVFVFGLANGSRIYYSNNKKLLYVSCGLFFIHFLLYFFNVTLLPILNGGIIGFVLYRTYEEFFSNK